MVFTTDLLFYDSLTGKKIGDIKTMELYIKPEESAVYYVINGTETGAVAF